MKTNLTKLTTLFLLCLLTFSAHAAMVLQDNFESYTTGAALPTNNFTLSPWIGNTGTPATPSTSTNGVQVVADPTGNSANALLVAQYLTEDIFGLATNKTYGDVTTTNGAGTTTNVFYGFSPSNNVNALYASMTLYVTSVPSASSGSQTYFMAYYSINSGYRARMFLITNNAAPGKFRIAIQNAGTAITNAIPADFSPNTAYTLVSRYLLGSSSSTVWINPVNESSSTSATAFDTQTPAVINGYAFRQSTSEGVVDIDNLLVGTTFADVVPGSLNAPVIINQPQDTNVFSGSSATFSTLALGDAPLGYQWFSVTNGIAGSITNSISGATSNVLTLTSLTTNQTGSIFCVITNDAGTNMTRLAVLTVSPQPLAPVIDSNITPAKATNIVGDTVVFTVVAHGLPAPSYQWKFVPATNNLVTNILAGATAATLTLPNITTNQAGSYFVTITNIVGTTNSALGTLVVNPPPFITIAQLRSMVDTNYAPTNATALFTVQGIVTTWTNMTSASSPEFFIQDSSGGIPVFWSGAGNSNTPPAGALVQVTAPFEVPIFDGLLELEPFFTNTLEPVTIISTNNPLPTAQPLPFDPNIQNNTAVMQSLVGSYFVASNVFLNLSSPTFTSDNEPITNIVNNVLSDTNAVYDYTFTNGAGQTFVLFINSHTDVPGQNKPTGPVTIFGVMNQFVAGSGPYVGGYEFTPSRFADIISYFHQTNVVSNARKGDLATNNYSELVLRPGESLTSYVSIGDAGGGSVSLTPVTGGLSPNSGWSNITPGSTATAVFNFSPTSADAGSNYMASLSVVTTSGSTYTNTFTVYVPTANEQQIAISEFLANPTTNSGAPDFNPLQRTTDTIGVVTNDEFIEIASQAPADVNLNGWGIYNGTKVEDFSLNGPTLSSSNAVVVFGGDSGEAPNLSVYNEPATSGKLALATSGTDTLILRNQNGNIIDRVVYSATALSTNSSLSRFPTLNSAFVPQAYISTNLTTAGLQYDGGSWGNPTKVPSGVTGVVISYVNGKAVLNFTANTTQASTLWDATGVAGPYSVIFGQPFPSGVGTFTNANSASQQFYFITTQ